MKLVRLKIVRHGDHHCLSCTLAQIPTWFRWRYYRWRAGRINTYGGFSDEEKARRIEENIAWSDKARAEWRKLL